MDGQSAATRGVVGGGFGAFLALLTGSTPIGVAIVAVLGAGLAIKYRSGKGWRGGSTDRG